VNKINKIGKDITILLNNPEQLESMSRAAYEISHPHSAVDIAQLIFNLEESHV